VTPKLEQVFLRVLDLPPDTDCRGLRYRHHERWDSVAQFQLVMEIEQEFGVTLSDEDVLKMSSFEQVLAIVQRAVGHGSPAGDPSHE
jgi:hypothetical protein